MATGHEQAYKELWGDSSEDRELSRNAMLETRMAQLVQRIYDGQSQDSGTTLLYYDAILVDEGQDFRL